VITESQETIARMKFGVITAVNIKTEIFWEMTACSLVLVIKSSERRAASDIEVLKAVVISTICFWAVSPYDVAYNTSV
jgi:hypothetical protein